jgi:hypothetical protein
MPAGVLNADGNTPTFNFLRALADNVWMIPHGTSPALAVFFLASLPNFLQAWELWLRGALLWAGIKVGYCFKVEFAGATDPKPRLMIGAPESFIGGW